MTEQQYQCRRELLRICCHNFRPNVLYASRFETLTGLCRWMPDWSAKDITDAAEWLIDNNHIDGSTCGFGIIRDDVMWELCIIGVNITLDDFDDKYAYDLEDMWEP